MVHSGDRKVGYLQLAGLVGEFAARLGGERRLIALTPGNDLGSLVAYLGALAAGCVVLLTGPGADGPIAAYDPDIVIEASPDGGIPVPDVRREQSAHVLHPDLALLLSTSGSTGSPKLVRLSYRNLFANAAAIARYLGIGPTDRAATTLPMFYCYGLSVLHSHLLRGASLLLTDRSVLDTEFWAQFTRHEATSFAAVPYTIDLLDRLGFERMSLPRLRYLTQAGGRLDPERVRHYAALGAARGWTFVVMYGQTEATARMAYLPAELAAEHPDCIGIPIPGGRFHLESDESDETSEGTGELVYRGPNVMLGYAHSAADLALGRTVTALRTGDLAVRTETGLYRVVGRRARFAKIFGLRIDLQRIESGLAAAGYRACCADLGDALAVVIAAPEPARTPLSEPIPLIRTLSGLPATAVLVRTVTELPRLPSGKPDYPAVRDLARPPRTPPGPTGSGEPEPAGDGPGRSAGVRLPRILPIGRAIGGRTANRGGIGHTTGTGDVRGLFAAALGVDRARIEEHRTFTELGGDSLSYVGLSVRLDRMLGRLPVDWPNRTVAELESLPRTRRRAGFGGRVETTTALRAIGIVLIVGSHVGLYEVWGGAHVLLAAAGFNFARFALTEAPAAQRCRRALRTAASIAVPTVLWVALTMLFWDDYGWQNLVLLSKILGPPDSPTAGHLWFVEVLVWCLVAAGLLVRVPVVDAAARRAPFWFPLALLAAALVVRFHSFGLYSVRDAPFSPLAGWLFLLGWAAAKARAAWQRVLLGAIVLVAIRGWFPGEFDRERLIFLGVLLLIWLPAVRVPALVAAAAAVLADASLFTYLLHWQVYPHLRQHPAVALPVSLAIGIAAAQLIALLRWWRPVARRAAPERRPDPAPHGPADSALHGPDLGGGLLGQFRDEQVAGDRLTGKVFQ